MINDPYDWFSFILLVATVSWCPVLGMAYGIYSAYWVVKNFENHLFHGRLRLQDAQSEMMFFLIVTLWSYIMFVLQISPLIWKQ